MCMCMYIYLYIYTHTLVYYIIAIVIIFVFIGAIYTRGLLLNVACYVGPILDSSRTKLINTCIYICKNLIIHVTLYSLCSQM